VTKHRVFSGPGFALAQELGDAADGGQVLLSHDAWLNLRHSMCDAGFPQVEQLGMYKLEAWPAPLWIYQVGLYRMLYRQPSEMINPVTKTVASANLSRKVWTGWQHTQLHRQSSVQLIRTVVIKCA